MQFTFHLRMKTIIEHEPQVDSIFVSTKYHHAIKKILLLSDKARVHFPPPATDTPGTNKLQSNRIKAMFVSFAWICVVLCDDSWNIFFCKAILLETAS